MKIVCDMHTHTIASGHAYSTILEMANVAKEKGIELLGITEHGPIMPGACHKIYFENLKVVPRKIGNVKLMLGAEVNIKDLNGGVDISQRLLGKIDYAIASFHPNCIQSGTREENTHAAIQVIKNPLIQILGHPDDDRFPLEYEEIAKAAATYHTIIELNNHSLGPDGARPGADANDAVLLELCRKYKVPIIINSDAHFSTQVGEHEKALAFIEQIKFPEELIINTSVDRCLEGLAWAGRENDSTIPAY